MLNILGSIEGNIAHNYWLTATKVLLIYVKAYKIYKK
jgi:hypothetical protein